MRGYWNRPYEQWQDVVRDGWVHTRDMARIDEEGFFYLVDRKNDMIITGGLNVFPNEVEQALYLNEDVLEVAVVGIDDREWGEIVTALVIPKEGRDVDAAALLESTKDTLSSFKRPRRLVLVDSLPKNAAGKIVRREVRDVLWPSVAANAVELPRGAA
jgi:acyl-CoA synthetase (AMP-forming)/AMP-acid ligase II